MCPLEKVLGKLEFLGCCKRQCTKCILIFFLSSLMLEYKIFIGFKTAMLLFCTIAFFVFVKLNDIKISFGESNGT